MAGPHHRTRHYVTNAPRVRADAYARPDYRCPGIDPETGDTCGRTHDQASREWGATAAAWEAGHIRDGELDGDLHAIHARCNRSAGARHGNRNREPHSRLW